ncbi:class I SAM-dependent methyltransferase [Thalassospira indica]|uniref:class I SAM-dependent methyltransferase n=1 Tax=Thalassospira indica TaxID=1891279 RepID=UPI000A902DA8|nr:class I SAM-dependent methyltransferase [Thalassospira indica]
MNLNDPRSTGYSKNYHDRQLQTPYQSTIDFVDWLEQIGVIGDAEKRICDIGCGKGANLHYLSKRFPSHTFTGVDIDEQLISEGRKLLGDHNLTNCKLVTGDIHDLKSQFKQNEFDGVISFQTLSWLPGYEAAIDSISLISPSWIAITSLFYDGPVETRTVIEQFDSSDKIEANLFYNTYSLPKFKKYLFKKGYTQFKSMRFEIPFDLPRNSDGRMQTYTEKTVDGRRLQVSGPLLMNWHFIFAAKENFDVY